MTLRKVNPGDPLIIPAGAYNSFVDAARAWQDSQFNNDSEKAFTRRQLWGRITGSTVAGTASNCQWLYSFETLILGRSADGAYPEPESLEAELSLSDMAINAVEINNHNATGSTVPYGNGIYPAQLDPDGDGEDEFAIEPIPDGQVVLLHQSSIIGDYPGTIFLFAAINPVSGECDE